MLVLAAVSRVTRLTDYDVYGVGLAVFHFDVNGGNLQYACICVCALGSRLMQFPPSFTLRRKIPDNVVAISKEETVSACDSKDD